MVRRCRKLYTINELMKNIFKNKYVKYISLFLLFVFILYVLIVTDNLVTIINFFKSYGFYMHIAVVFMCFSLLLYFIINLYTLHKCVMLHNKGEKLNISAVIPDFYNRYLKKMSNYSTDIEIVKYLKRNYYTQAIIYAIMFASTLNLLFLN